MAKSSKNAIAYVRKQTKAKHINFDTIKVSSSKVKKKVLLIGNNYDKIESSTRKGIPHKLEETCIKI